MLNTNATQFRKNLFNILEQTVKYNEPVNISTKDGNVVLISEEDYRGLTETLFLTSIPGMEGHLVNAAKKPITEGIPESEIEW
ncbi:MAG: type II toxin-antitoxin system Phd/YefM family antitoxin [Clostridia bacterium]|jgi:PHD/YefM family antitoxin component YafN of YafNO toxin-antitoxin module|nr:type II toxin-antitoxin system Phd/YefM family antitoxin [Clostridia bacterium]